jgi:hypothetical protein
MRHVHHPIIEKFREDNVLQGFFENEALERLIFFLPEDLKDFVWLAYSSGWGKGRDRQAGVAGHRGGCGQVAAGDLQNERR